MKDLIERLRTDRIGVMQSLGEQAADAIEKLEAENAALKAELAAMRNQKPVAWAMLRDDGLVLDVICPDEHESYEGDYKMPLYAAPGAKPATERVYDALPRGKV